jgi:hypothetical protein
VRLVVARRGSKREVALMLRSPGPQDWTTRSKEKEDPWPWW